MKLPETIRAAFVIARRDFTATVPSKTFLFFLLGPLFPILLGFTFGGIGAQMKRNAPPPTVAVIASSADFALIKHARDRLAVLSGDRPIIDVRRVPARGNAYDQVQALLADERLPVLGVLEGGLDAPELSSQGDVIKQVELFVTEARQLRVAPIPPGQQVKFIIKKKSAGTLAVSRGRIARAGQALLFLLTILLAGMLLSQLIEEKSNKVIEILAAAVPIDAIFLGKLFAMLAMSLVGIAVWTSAGAAAIAYWANGGLGAIPTPAVGWPTFLSLMLVYFAMSYLLIGGVFLGIGGQASTVREVQTLSMPVTMAQVLIFGLANLAVGQPDQPEALAAAIFPLSSPYAMIARAAEQDAMWPHLVAFAWQGLWIALILKFAANLFRTSVLKSGSWRRWPWQRKPA